MSNAVKEAARLVQFSRATQSDINLNQARARFAAVKADIASRNAVRSFLKSR